MNYAVSQIIGAVPTTLALTGASMACAFPIGLLAGLARLSRFRLLRWATTVYVEVFRGSSLLVQLYWAYFVLPLIGVRISAVVAGVVTLSLNEGAYASEIVRGAIRAVDRVQWEAAVALNLSPWTRMRRVILPQALPTMVPSFGNVAIDILKGTAVFSLITVAELTTAVDTQTLDGNVSFTNGYIGLLFVYFILSLPLMAGTRIVERLATRHLRPSAITERAGLIARAQAVRGKIVQLGIDAVKAGDGER